MGGEKYKLNILAAMEKEYCFFGRPFGLPQFNPDGACWCRTDGDERPQPEDHPHPRWTPREKKVALTFGATWGADYTTEAIGDFAAGKS